MNKRIGFIGCGNMAQAMIGGIINAGFATSKEIIASNPNHEKLDFVANKYAITVTNCNLEVARVSDILILAVKPAKYGEVLAEINNDLKSKTLIVSIAAGIDLEFVEKNLRHPSKVIRTMPNTPVLVGAGMTAICPNKAVSNEELSQVVALFESFGLVQLIPESQMDAIPAISGSSPAYVFMFIEALADGGVLSGLPRDITYKMAAQAVLGAAKMVLQTGKHPGELKDMVCTPGGMTIEAVADLEQKNFRGSIISGMKACNRKALELKTQG